MPLAYHTIFGLYAFWLPNDPRGSWSTFVGSWDLFRFGRATKVDTRRSVAHVPHDAAVRRAAKRTLKYEPVVLSGRQARAVGAGFARACGEGSYAIYECSILPEHVHLVIRHEDRSVGRMLGHLKARATQQLAREGLWPDEARPVWGGPGWKVFLDTPADVRRAIAYVAANPQREGKPPQRWSFVTPFDEEHGE